MAHRNILWQTPPLVLFDLVVFETFQDSVPLSWELAVGDCFEFELCLNISGSVMVLEVGTDVTQTRDPNFEDESCGLLEDNREVPEVDAVLCTFRKIS